MSYADVIVTALKADSTLIGTLTGGVWNYPDTGRKGLTRLLSPGAFNEATGLVKPAAVVLQLKEVADNQIIDPVSGYNSTVTPIMIWVYDNGFTDTGYSNIEIASKRIYQLLAYQQLTGMFQILFDGYVAQDKREPLLKDAAFWTSKYNVYASQSFT
jgi:hypothetical protein